MSSTLRSGTGWLNIGNLGSRRLAVAGGGVHRVLVELGDHLVAEDLEHLEDLVVLDALAGQPEHHLVAADVLVAHDLLAHLFGRAAEHVAALDELVEQLFGPRHLRSASSAT